MAAALAALVPAAPAAPAPVSAHAMVHACCTPAPMKERIFAEASRLGARFIRVDIEVDGIFAAAGEAGGDEPNWEGLDSVVELSKRHDLPVLGILLGPPAHISACPERGPDSRRCAAADTAEWGRLAGEIASRAAPAVRHWEILNQPDGEWAFDGTAEDYARMLAAAHDGIKARVPEAKVVLGGLMKPHERAWLERVFATPGADALHKFDIANIHLRGPAGPVASRYREVRSRLEALGFAGPLWVTEHGYPADPAYQDDPAHGGGEPGQASYLTQSLVALGELGAEQVFVTLRDNPELEGEYLSEGLVRIDDAPGTPVTRRPSFGAVRRLALSWDEVMEWLRLQREHEQRAREHYVVAVNSAAAEQAARAKLREARLKVRPLREALARPRLRSGMRRRLERRLARARALVAGHRIAVLWHSGYGSFRGARARDHAAAAELLKAAVAGAG